MSPVVPSSEAFAKIIDLVDIALLLNFERATTEPRFRHTRLIAVTQPGEEPSYRFTKNPHIKDARACLTIELDKQQGDADTPDLPKDMLPENPAKTLSALTPKELETIFYQVRGHNGCYTTVALLQHFFDLFTNATPLRIRHRPTQKKRGASLTNGDSYTTRIDKRVILEMVLVRPKLYQSVVISPLNSTYISGQESIMDHAVVGFAPLDSDLTSSILDLSSMQFGDVGRGFGDPKHGGGEALFILETGHEYQQRIARIADVDPDHDTKLSTRIAPTPQDEWLKQVANRVKERWEKRHEEHWCSHCGVGLPGGGSRCSGCKAAWFCGKEHQAMAWNFHKGYCAQHLA